MTSGFRVTLTAWLPCADDLDSLIEARERIGDLRQDAAMAGFGEIAVATEFMKFRLRAKALDLTPIPSPPAAHPIAEPTQPLDHAPAETAEVGATEDAA